MEVVEGKRHALENVTFVVRQKSLHQRGRACFIDLKEALQEDPCDQVAHVV